MATERITAPNRVLAAVLFNPPLTSGDRTRARVKMAAGVLGYDKVRITNLFAVPTSSVLGVQQFGSDETSWSLARKDIGETLASSSAVLLAYGVQQPVGMARHHFWEQLYWLESEIERLLLPVWTVSDEPRHPSRWQRFTARRFPNLPFRQALVAALQLQQKENGNLNEKEFRLDVIRLPNS